jgi:hypothetical protein
MFARSHLPRCPGDFSSRSLLPRMDTLSPVPLFFPPCQNRMLSSFRLSKGNKLRLTSREFQIQRNSSRMSDSNLFTKQPWSQKQREARMSMVESRLKRWAKVLTPERDAPASSTLAAFQRSSSDGQIQRSALMARDAWSLSGGARKPIRRGLVSLSVLAHSKNDLKLKCTEFDAKGNVKTTAGEFSKIDLCNQNGLQPRDLRKLDSSFKNQLPAILVRAQAILVNLVSHVACFMADSM